MDGQKHETHMQSSNGKMENGNNKTNGEIHLVKLSEMDTEAANGINVNIIVKSTCSNDY